MKCNLGYDKCVLYLDWLEIVDFIHRTHNDGHETIRLSERGMDLYKNKLDESKSEFKSQKMRCEKFLSRNLTYLIGERGLLAIPRMERQ